MAAAILMPMLFTGMLFLRLVTGRSTKKIQATSSDESGVHIFRIAFAIAIREVS